MRHVDFPSEIPPYMISGGKCVCIGNWWLSKFYFCLTKINDQREIKKQFVYFSKWLWSDVIFFFFFLMLIDTLNLAHLLLSKWSNCKISLFMWRRRKIEQTWKSLLRLDNTTTCLDRHDLNFWPILDRMTESCFCPNVIVFSLKPKFYLWRSGTLSKLDF